MLSYGDKIYYLHGVSLKEILFGIKVEIDL
jgi:hypothetical protein